MLGHVNSAVHYTYFELARIEYFDLLDGGSKTAIATNVVVAKTEMEYIHQLLIEDKIAVSVWVTRVGTKSFDMNCSIVKDVDGLGIEVAKGKAVVVCLNPQLNKSIAVPEAWKEKMLGK